MTHTLCLNMTEPIYFFILFYFIIYLLNFDAKALDQVLDIQNLNLK